MFLYVAFDKGRLSVGLYTNTGSICSDWKNS